jgi:hypothetical protein
MEARARPTQNPTTVAKTVTEPPAPEYMTSAPEPTTPAPAPPADDHIDGHRNRQCCSVFGPSGAPPRSHSTVTDRDTLYSMWTVPRSRGSVAS